MVSILVTTDLSGPGNNSEAGRKLRRMNPKKQLYFSDKAYRPHWNENEFFKPERSENAPGKP